MLLEILLYQIAHFSISAFSSLVFFATGWLYLDSWRGDKRKTPLIRSIGFFLVSLSFALRAPGIEFEYLHILLNLLQTLGLVLILLSLVAEPVLSKPKMMALYPILPAIPFFNSLLYLAVSVSVFIKSTNGLERQLAPLSLAFLVLFFASVLNSLSYLPEQRILFINSLISRHGPVWILQHVIELFGSLILARWVWGYLRFRPGPQIFILTVSSSLVIFLLTTSLFTTLLIKNLEQDLLSNLKTNVKVLQYGVERLQGEVLTNAKAIAGDSEVNRAVASENAEDLFSLTSKFMLSQNSNFVETIDKNGEVIMRAEDKDRIGDNLSNDHLVKSALLGKPLAAPVLRNTPTAPVVEIKGAAPLRDSLGAVTTGVTIDNAFVDGVRAVTGLDATVFSGNTRSATTFVQADGKTRSIGTKQESDKVKGAVLERGNLYTGKVSILNEPNYASYYPLKSLNGEVIGMLSVSKPQTALLETAEKSIALTFAGSLMLMVLSMIPAYFFSRYLEENVNA